MGVSINPGWRNQPRSSRCEARQVRFDVILTYCCHNFACGAMNEKNNSSRFDMWRSSMAGGDRAKKID
jgi:hypothetical protein